MKKQYYVRKYSYRSVGRGYGKIKCPVCKRLFKPSCNHHFICRRCGVRLSRKYRHPGAVLLCRMCGKPIENRFALVYCSPKCAREGYFYKAIEFKLEEKRQRGTFNKLEDFVLDQKINQLFYSRKIRKRRVVINGKAFTRYYGKVTIQNPAVKN